MPTRPERIVGRLLRELFPGEVEEQARDLPGTPDFVLRRWRTAVFVHGCFWHACTECHQTPRKNRQFWRRKAGKNVRRDRLVRMQLSRLGFKVEVVWEHELEKMVVLEQRLGLLKENMHGF